MGKSILNFNLIAMIASIFISTLSFAQTPPVSAVSQQLIDLTMNRSPSAPGMTVDAVKALIASGADMNAKNVGGSYPFLLAVETYSYWVGANDPRTANAKAVAEYLMSQGSEISAVDGRGLAPTDYLLAYSPDLSLVNELFAKGVRFDGPNPHGRNLLHDLVTRGDPAVYPILEYALAHLSDLHLSIDSADEDGLTPVFVAAASGTKDAQGTLVLQRYLQLIPEPRRSELADLPDASGMSPLMAAISQNRTLTIDYLLTNFKVDLNRKNTDGETPVSIAIAHGNTALVTRLESMGAAAPATTTPTLSCKHANAEPFGFNELKTLIYVKCKKKIHSIDDLLPLLPSSLKTHYSLMYATQGLAKADPNSPRAILYGRDGKLVISFGDKHFDDPLAESLEFYSFDDTQKTFNFYELQFPKSTLKGARPKTPILSDANPAKCVSCHGLPAHPIWNSWTLWPGAYFGEMENLYPGAGERSDYQNFLAKATNDTSSRYHQLLPYGLLPVQSDLGRYQESVFSPGRNRNLSMDFLMSSLMGQRISAEMGREARLKPFRYAILAGLSCSDSISNYLTPAMQASLPRTEAELFDETQALAKEEQASRLAHQETVRPGTPTGRYNIEISRSDLYPFPGPNTVGFSGDAVRINALRYVIEGVLGDGAMAGWFTDFNDNRPSYSAVLMSDVETRAWKSLLDPVVDADLLAIYQSAAAQIRISQVTLWIKDLALPVQANLCALLKQKAQTVQIQNSSISAK